jgi:hypothetical protein
MRIRVSDPVAARAGLLDAAGYAAVVDRDATG